MSDNLEGEGSPFFDLFDNNNWASDFSPTPDQHLGDRASLLSPDDDPMNFVNLSPAERSYLLTGSGESGTNEPPLLAGPGPGEDIQQPEYVTMEVPSDTPPGPGPGEDIQQPEYVKIEVPSEPNEPPLLTGPREDIQQTEYATIEVSSDTNEPPLSPGDRQESSSSSKSTGSGSKKRKSVAKRKGKEKIQRRNRGTFCMGESSNSKKPENPEKKDNNVKRLADGLNRRKTSANDIQNQLRRAYEQLEKSSPLRAKLEQHEEDLKKMELEIEDVKKEITIIQNRCKKREITKDEEEKELIKIEEEKLPKFLADVDKARKGLREGRKEAKKELEEMGKDFQNMNNRSVEMLKGIANIRKVHNKVLEVTEKTDNLAECITKDCLSKEQQEKLLSEIAHLYRAITRFPQISTKEPLLLEVPGQNPEEDCGQQPQSLDEQITDLDERIHVLRAQRDELVRRRANQLAQGQYPQTFDEQITYIDGLIKDLLDERDVFVGMHGILHAQGP